MVLAMHAGFAFLELGTVRRKNQVNALVKILSDFAVSTLAYFFIGYGVAYGLHFMVGAEQLTQQSGYELVKFFFLLTFAAAIPAIVSGGMPSGPSSCPNWPPPSCWWPSSIHSSRASPGASISASSPGWRRSSARNSTTSPARWWCMRSAGG